MLKAYLIFNCKYFKLVARLKSTGEFYMKYDYVLKTVFK